MYDPIRMEIDEETRDAIRQALSDMESKVDLLIFTSRECRYCDEMLKIVNILVEESPSKNDTKLLSVKVYKLEESPDVFRKYSINRTPTLVLLDGNIRYLGVPSGEELKGLVETIIRISQKDSGLERETIEKIKEIDNPVKIEVIVNPQCPYCPYAALISNMFAFAAKENGKEDFITYIVEAYENPDIADKYNVMTVPAIVINGVLAFVGVPYEEEFIERIIEIAVHRKTVETERVGETEPL